MPYQVLYRAYRPSDFSEVVGQDYIVKTLSNAIKQQKIAHAYLFCGPRGTGKTSVAKLFAKAINCHGKALICNECPNCQAFNANAHPDIIELDAASNNSVDNIREIVDKVKYAPILGQYKVYIIDEVHMLSSSAFNALLKTLEEPPHNVIFILATTEPNKVIPTVMSRCQRFNFQKIAPQAMKERLRYILEKEQIPYEKEAADLIISLSDGGMRDVLSILEEVLAYGNYQLKTEDVKAIFGILAKKEKIKLLTLLKEGNIAEAIALSRTFYQKGIDLKRLAADLLVILKEVYLYHSGAEELLNDLTTAEAQELATLYPPKTILKDINEIMATLDNYHQNSDLLNYFEVLLFNLASKQTIKEDSTPLVSKAEISIPVKKETVTTPLEGAKFNSIACSPTLLLSILKRAERQYKLQDVKIYQRLNDYEFDSENRRYALMLKNSEIFASAADAIIFKHLETCKKQQINDCQNNKGLYFFLKREFAIDKMPFCIDEKECLELIRLFKAKRTKAAAGKIEKYAAEENDVKDLPSLLKETFGDLLKVED